jgi:transcriptional regulator of acetoin/glycerol metabolism
MTALQSAHWEYNLRELDGVIHRLIAEADPAAEITFDHCVGDLDHLRVRSRGRPTKSSPEKVADTVKHADSIADAARALSVSRSTVYRKLAKIGEVAKPRVAD